jgi:VanZ family protein
MQIALSSAIAGLTPLLAFVVIGALSLVPGEMRPHTGYPGQAEHFLAYWVAAVAICIQQRTWINRIAFAVALCLYAGILEILQIWIPGRHSQLIDFAASASGAVSGCLLVTIVIRSWNSKAPKD